jgi:hypothetical protein
LAQKRIIQKLVKKSSLSGHSAANNPSNALTWRAVHGEIGGGVILTVMMRTTVKNIWLKCEATAAIAAMTMGLCNIAVAQYVWVDEKGTKQFSDQPPPPSVPKTRILKMPSAQPVFAAVPAATTNDQAPVAAAADAKLPLTTAEKNADFQKRKLEQTEKDKKDAYDEAKKAENKKTCNSTRDYQRTLESGIRITQTDKVGEQIFMTEEQRTKALRDIKSVLTNDCK